MTEIQIYGVIGWEVLASDIKEQIDAASGDLVVAINSPGGSVWDGNAIHNLLSRYDRGEVHARIDGVALSAASYIAMAGDLITMPENGAMMIHNAWSFVIGNATDMEAEAALMRRWDAGIAQMYATRTGRDLDDIKALMEDETWFFGEEAVDAGFADIIEGAVDTDDDPQDIYARAADKIRDLHRPEQIHQIAAQLRPVTPSATDENHQEDDDMPDGNQSAKTADEIRAEAMAEDKARRTEIRALFGPHSESHADLLDECLDDTDTTPDAAGRKLLARLGENATPAGSVTMVRDERDNVRAAVGSAIDARSGGERDPQNECNGLTLIDLGARCLNAAGVSTRGMSRDQIASRLVSAHTTSDFDLLLANQLGKQLRGAYGNFADTWDAWCDSIDVPDFKSNSLIQVGSFGNLALKNEAGAYKHTSMGEEAEAIQASEKGLMVSFTRRMLINDDLGAFLTIGRRLGRAAARSVEADVYGVVNANPTMSDGTALFHADHNNLAGSGAAIGTATLSDGKTALRTQTDIDGNEYLDLRARSILCPVDLEALALDHTTSNTDPEQENPGKRARHGDLQVISTPYLTGTAWYLACDPMDAPLVSVAFLNGQRQPFVDDDMDFDTDAHKFKVRLDYGVAATDFRGGWKNAGS